MASPVGENRTLSALLITNLVLGLLTLALAIGFLYFRFVYEPEADPSAAEPYLTEAKERFNEHSDEIAAEAASLAQDIAPPIGDAIYTQVREDYPAYMRALETRGKEYLANAEKILVNQVKAQYGDYLRAHRDVIKEEFPEHASDENVEKVLNDFEEVTDRIVERYYLEEFRQESERTVALWKQFEPLPVPGPDEPSLHEQLADYTADWTILAVSAEDNRPASTRPAPEGATPPPMPDTPDNNDSQE